MIHFCFCLSDRRPEIQECVLRETASESAAFCLNDPSCAGFNYKPAGSFLTRASVAIFKHATNRSAMTFSPSVVLYLRDGAAATDGTAAQGSSGGGGLSAGAIAGIACGAAAAAAAAGFAGWALLQRRRQRKRTGGEEVGRRRRWARQ